MGFGFRCPSSPQNCSAVVEEMAAWRHCTETAIAPRSRSSALINSRTCASKSCGNSTQLAPRRMSTNLQKPSTTGTLVRIGVAKFRSKM